MFLLGVLCSFRCFDVFFSCCFFAHANLSASFSCPVITILTRSSKERHDFLEINLKGGKLVGCESKGGGGVDPIRGGVGNIGSETSTQTLPEHDQRHLQHKPSPLQHPQYHLEHNPSSSLHSQEQHHPQHQTRAEE